MLRSLPSEHDVAESRGYAFGLVATPRRTANAVVRLIFDSSYYLRQYADVAAARIDPLTHFLSTGWAELRNPCALFDTALYLDRYPDVAAVGLNPLLHYARYGARERRQVSLLFDTDWYLARNPDVAATGVNPLAHYLAVGAREGREANPLFDQDWYLQRYPHAADAGRCALAHFAENGAREKLSPHPSFDSGFYLERNPDVTRAGVNPLAHYLAHGRREGRAIRRRLGEHTTMTPAEGLSVSRQKEHLLLVSSIPSSNGDQAGHRTGAASGDARIDLEHYFDAGWYTEAHKDLIAPSERPFDHYLRRGTHLGFNPNPFFDPLWYRRKNPDVLRYGYEPLSHYLATGWRVGCQPSPFVDDHWIRTKVAPGYAADATPLPALLKLYRSEARAKAPKTAEFIRGDMQSVAGLAKRLEALKQGKEKKRIAYFSHDLLWQGAQNSLFELVEAKVGSADYEPVVFSFRDGPLAAEYVEVGAQLFILPMHMFSASLDALAHVFEAAQIDVVHANTTRCYEAIAAAQLAGIKTLWNIRESDEYARAFEFIDERQTRFIYDHVVPATDRIVFVAHSTAELWPRDTRLKKHVIANAINEMRFLGPAHDLEIERKLNAERVTFLCVGTFTERKDQRTIVRALSRLPDNVLRRIEFVFVGKIDSEYGRLIGSDLLALAASRPIKILVLPHTATPAQRKAVVQQYFRTHCFVQASLNESYPRVVLEALTAGCDVIASDSFGTSEILGREYPLLFTPGDADSLSLLIKRYVEEDALRGLCTRGNILSRLQSFPTMVRQYDEIYNALLS